MMNNLSMSNYEKAISLLNRMVQEGITLVAEYVPLRFTCPQLDWLLLQGAPRDRLQQRSEHERWNSRCENLRREKRLPTASDPVLPISLLRGTSQGSLSSRLLKFDALLYFQVRADYQAQEHR